MSALNSILHLPNTHIWYIFDKCRLSLYIHLNCYLYDSLNIHLPYYVYIKPSSYYPEQLEILFHLLKQTQYLSLKNPLEKYYHPQIQN